VSLTSGEVVKAVDFSGRPNILYRRNSQTGAVEAISRNKSWGASTPIFTMLREWRAGLFRASARHWNVRWWAQKQTCRRLVRMSASEDGAASSSCQRSGFMWRAPLVAPHPRGRRNDARNIVPVVT
jgi:hypothetical protein